MSALSKFKQAVQFIRRMPFVHLSGQAGFSLVELVVVIGIIGIVLAIASLPFHAWQVKAAVEKQTAELHGELSNLRTLSITKKMEHRAFLNAGNYLFRQYTSAADDGNAASSTIANINTPYVIQNGAFGTAASNLIFVFDERGYFSGPADTVTVVVGPADADAYTNCLVVSGARINLGKMDNAGKCIFR